MSTDVSNLGIQLRNARIKKELSQETLAELSKVSLRTIQRIELGQVNPRNSTLNLLTKTLDLEISKEESTQSSDKKVKVFKIMNLILIVLLPIPLTNILVSFIFLGVFSKYKLLSKQAKKMISFQILWSVVTLLLFFLGVFFTNLITQNAGNGLYVGMIIYSLCLFLNIYIIAISTFGLSRKNKEPLSFIPDFF